PGKSAVRAYLPLHGGGWTADGESAKGRDTAKTNLLAARLERDTLQEARTGAVVQQDRHIAGIGIGCCDVELSIAIEVAYDDRVRVSAHIEVGLGAESA